MASASSYNSPCAACKFLRRKCMPGCIFAPYFPPEEPQKFANVHKIFGASNVTKLLNDLLPHQREDAVNSLAYEAEARGFGNHLAVLLFPETSPHLKPWEAINTRIREWECDKRVQLQSTMFRCPLPSHKDFEDFAE
ncbi:hypothetical protein L2E82_10592 [Cichorium intybus]|uniref:Uncharacterized protein n=1 Tax=Cichorium intybus TaxID=13427 RepID=A0ACB9GAW3_CICIN|nr:hypothetical protein L2E82_10592 [Cichorium intybus]